METGKVLLGVTVGMAAGAILGILFAPDKGSKTRKKILRKGGDFTDTLKDKFNDFVDSISEKFDDAKHEADGMVEKGKRKIASLKVDD